MPVTRLMTLGIRDTELADSPQAFGVSYIHDVLPKARTRDLLVSSQPFGFRASITCGQRSLVIEYVIRFAHSGADATSPRVSVRAGSKSTCLMY